MIVGAALALISPFADAQAGEPCTRAAAQVATTAERRTTAEVERRIAADDTLSPLARSIQVTTAEGIVTLRGVVADNGDRLVLASLAESAPGVRRVDDRLEIRREIRR